MSATSTALLAVGGGAAALWGWSHWRDRHRLIESGDGWAADHDDDPVEPVPNSGELTRGASPIAHRDPARRLSRRFDATFARYGLGLPVPYLRALAAGESGLNPADPKGLINVVRVAREDFNRRHHTGFTAADLTDRKISVVIAADTLRTIIANYARHHPAVRNLREDWSNRAFVELLTFGWNAGFSEASGVGRVARYLEARGQTEIRLDDVVRAAHDAGTSHWLWAHPKKVAWTRGVVGRYFQELGRDLAAQRTAPPRPAPTPMVAPASAPPAREPDRLDLGRPLPIDVRAIVSSGWARRRKHGSHRALDIPVPAGTPILAIDDGVVVRVQRTPRDDAGTWLAIKHASGLTSRYLHLSRVRVDVGQVVRRGETIGRSGNTGASTGPHLHLDLRASPELLAAVERWIGRPHEGWGPAVAPWGVSIPGEPWIPVDGYAETVMHDAIAAGIPLHRPPSVEPRPTTITIADAEPVSRPDQVDPTAS